MLETVTALITAAVGAASVTKVRFDDVATSPCALVDCTEYV
jgi:hypothetical protein